MRALWLLVGVTGCNQIYGLNETRLVDASLVDAAFFDVREDFTCPPIGETPKFSATLTPVARSCTDYSESPSTGIATAYCTRPVSGPLDGPFAPIPTLGDAHVMPRLAPEGDVLYVRENLNPGYALRMFMRDGDTFTAKGTVAYTVQSDNVVAIGVPALGGRMLVGQYMTAAPTMFEEIVIASDGSVSPVRTHTAAELGVSSILGAPNLTPDGLRMTYPARVGDVATGSNHMMYSDRAQLGDPFAMGRILENIPFVTLQRTPFLNASCSRIYTQGGDQLVWAQRIE